MKIEVNGIELFYVKTGSGPALIMLHGNGETQTIFDKAVPLLSNHFTVYCIDSRGHGESTRLNEYHYDDMAEDVRCFIEATGLERPVLYGFSDGGIIALLLASHHPQLLSRIIISGANLDPDGIKLQWKLLLSLAGKLKKNPLFDLMSNEPHISREMLQKIEIPVTVLAGSRDLVKSSHTCEIADNIKNSRLKIIKGQDHGSYIVHKEDIAHLILEACE